MTPVALAPTPLITAQPLGPAGTGRPGATPTARGSEPVLAGSEPGPGADQPVANPDDSSEAQVARAADDGARGRIAEGEAAPNAQNDALADELTPQELRLLRQLEQTDREVRQHELAHQIAGGPYTGSASYRYEIGPDGKRYAVAGEVSVDYGPVTGDPQATVEKMKTVIAAALAPADPSPADYQIAARARQNLLVAQLELSQQQSTRQSVAPASDAASGQAANSEMSVAHRDAQVAEYERTAQLTDRANDPAGAGLSQGTLHSLA